MNCPKSDEEPINSIFNAHIGYIPIQDIEIIKNI